MSINEKDFDNDELIAAADRIANVEKEKENDDEEEQLIDPDTIQRDGMLQIHINAYSVGHYFNDLCACMWFVYLTWYLIKIVDLPNNIAGLAVLSG